jgi:hypothetical protein
MHQPMPLWVKIFAGLGLAALVVVIVLHAGGNGLHCNH